MSSVFADKQKLGLLVLLASSSLLLTACTGGGGGSITAGGGGGNNQAGPAQLQITSVYPTSSGSTWTPIVSSSRYYIKGLSITVLGNCDRGIATVQVNEGAGNYPETSNCAGNGTFLWQKTYTGPLDANKTLTLAGYDLTGTVISGTSTTVPVHMDSVAPVAPVVTTPPTANYTYAGNGTAYTLIGTNSADTHVITVNGATVIPSGTNWSYPVTLVDGGTSTFTIYAFDLAGNQSSGVTVSILYAPSIVLGENVDADVSGGLTTDMGSSGFTLESASFMTPSTFKDLLTNFTLDTGFNYLSKDEGAN